MFIQTALTQPHRGAASFRRPRAPGRLQAYGALCAVSFVFYIAGRLSGGLAGTLCLAIGVGACGWAWLLTRALFDPSRHDARWPRVVVAVVALSGALSVLTPGSDGLSRIAANAYALSGSAALLLTFVEPFHARGARMTRSETRFRIAFLIVYAALIVVAVLGLTASEATPEETIRNDLIKSACAVVGLAAGSAAVWFRAGHPLDPPERPQPVRRAATAGDRQLAARLLTLLRDEALDARPELRIGDVAARLGQPEYRVSQCISAALGFANFNRLINHHRIARARRLLADPDHDRSILEVAFECGFGSLGPFNRAFKNEVGVTPRDYRTASRGGPSRQKAVSRSSHPGPRH